MQYTEHMQAPHGQRLSRGGADLHQAIGQAHNECASRAVHGIDPLRQGHDGSRAL